LLDCGENAKMKECLTGERMQDYQDCAKYPHITPEEMSSDNFGRIKTLDNLGRGTTPVGDETLTKGYLQGKPEDTFGRRRITDNLGGDNFSRTKPCEKFPYLPDKFAGGRWRL